MQNNFALVFDGEAFKPLAWSQCWEMIENANVFKMFTNLIQQEGYYIYSSHT